MASARRRAYRKKGKRKVTKSRRKVRRTKRKSTKTRRGRSKRVSKLFKSGKKFYSYFRGSNGRMKRVTGYKYRYNSPINRYLRGVKFASAQHSRKRDREQDYANFVAENADRKVLVRPFDTAGMEDEDW